LNPVYNSAFSHTRQKQHERTTHLTPEHRQINTPRSSHNRVWAIAGPAILANSSTPLVGLVDTWAVGHLPGAIHLAAVGLGSVVFNYIFWAFGFLRMGTTGLVAQAQGRDDKAEVSAIVLRSVVLALGLGITLLVLQHAILSVSFSLLTPPDDVARVTAEYFQIRIWAAPVTLVFYALSGVLFGLAHTRAVLLLQLVLNITNGVLNVVFVVGLDMGVPGVALGTLIAQWLATLVGIWLLVRLLGIPALLAAVRSAKTWMLDSFRSLVAINGFIFVRTILLMTALTMIMRIAGGLGEVEMAVSHVLTQYLLLISLGLDGFAHAAEALSGRAWGSGNIERFRHWVRITTIWALVASLGYSLLFWLGGNAITAVLTDIEAVRMAVFRLMPLVIALPVVAVWSYQFDGVFIGATAGGAMLVTMAIAFAVYFSLLGPMTRAWGLTGLWMAVLLFMAVRGLTQAIWYPRLVARLKRG
jgi:MATE family multidrug resistance protein